MIKDKSSDGSGLTKRMIGNKSSDGSGTSQKEHVIN